MDSQKQADGFIAHYAIVDDGGVTEIEIWESVDDHDAWFNPTVKPHLPADMPNPEFSEIHFSNTMSNPRRRAWGLWRASRLGR